MNEKGRLAYMFWGAFSGSMIMILLALFTSWGFDPGSWDAVNRFVYAIIFLAVTFFGGVSGYTLHETKTNDTP